MHKRAIRYFFMASNSLLLFSTSTFSYADDQPLQLQNLVVTGELLSRTVQESGNSVVILDREVLSESTEMRTVRDVLNSTPNIVDVMGTGKAPTIRGVDGTGPAENAFAFFGSATSRLNWQIDGRTASYNEIAYGDIGIWDLERIEVLRGSQSTLTGRNAIAGTIRIETNDPSFEAERSIRLETGNLGQTRGSLMLNQPLTETVAFRIAADRFEKDSPVNFDSYDGVGNPGEIDGQSVRAKLLFEPNDRKKTRLLISLSNNEHEGPNGERVIRPFNEQRAELPLQPVHITKSNTLGVEYSSSFNDKLKLEINTAFSNIGFTRKITSGVGAKLDRNEVELEPRLRYFGDNSNEWVVGTRLFHASQEDEISLGVLHSYDDDTDGRALYIEGATPIGSSFELITGLRYEHEKRKREGGDLFGPFTLQVDTDKTYTALLPKLGLNYTTDEDHVYGVLVSKGFNPGGANVTLGIPSISYEYDDETVNTIELFGRQHWLSGRLETTQNLFYSDYKDMQVPVDRTPENGGDEDFIIENLDGVRTFGAELGVNWQANQQWQLFASLALLKSEITDYSDDSSLEGNSLPMSSSFSMQAGAAWQAGPWNVNLSGHFTDGWYTRLDNRSTSKTDAFATIDANVGYKVNKRTKLYVAARNLFDDDSPIALFPETTQGDVAVLTQPRSVTAGVLVSF